ncbi:hypothetical protein EX30DRAFT_171372 [Ascodesmis nigricans]|uniref:Uncharacterized protein n=1 Tax=Ascodesmis nigricans TaxID=341454 RepID=A0A4S2MLT7_9PEZI|nr:hypothetical protein EX30DRAFT_171372 [Ascodesmis nigricans]
MATFDLPSILTSPPLLLRLPASEKTYTLHRTLLQSPHTNLLTNTKRRTTTLQLPPGTHQSSLERVLEYLYTRRYDGLLSHGAGEEEDGEEEEEEQHPIVAAAAKGAIGVWDGPKPVFTKARNWSSYTSIYVPGLQNAYDGEISASTTEFADYEPQLRDPQSQQDGEEEEEKKKKKRKQEQRAADPSQRLHTHLDIYFLSRRFEVLGLPEQVLAAIAAEAVRLSRRRRGRWLQRGGQRR